MLGSSFFEHWSKDNRLLGSELNKNIKILIFQCILTHFIPDFSKFNVTMHTK